MKENIITIFDIDLDVDNYILIRESKDIKGAKFSMLCFIW